MAEEWRKPLTLTLIKFGTDVIKFGTDAVKFGTDVIMFGTDVIMFGTDAIKFGTDIIKFGTGAINFSCLSLAYLSKRDPLPIAAHLLPIFCIFLKTTSLAHLLPISCLLYYFGAELHCI